MKGVCITSDLDWAPMEVVEYFLEILEDFNIDATLFFTNTLDNNFRNHEIALHPNFKTMDLAMHIDEIKKLFPEAIGLRSHSLFFSERLRPIYKDIGIAYQSNFMMYLQENIKPFMISRDTLEIPLFWMDMFYLEMENCPSFAISKRLLMCDGIKVFDFHPVHVFLNTHSIEHYNLAKKEYQNPSELIRFRNNTKRGVKDYLEDLLNEISRENLTVFTLSQVLDKFNDNLVVMESIK